MMLESKEAAKKAKDPGSILTNDFGTLFKERKRNQSGGNYQLRNTFNDFCIFLM